jgi:hypothetical protein
MVGLVPCKGGSGTYMWGAGMGPGTGGWGQDVASYDYQYVPGSSFMIPNGDGTYTMYDTIGGRQLLGANLADSASNITATTWGMGYGVMPTFGAANNGVTAAIRAGDPNAKKKYCAHQSNMAALEAILPGGSVLLGGDYSPTAVGEEAGQEALREALDAGAKSTGFLSMVRSWTGIPMSVTSKVLTGLGYAITAFDLYSGMKAMQKEYAACVQ